MLLHGVSDLNQRCLKTHNFEDECTFPPNTFAPTPKIITKPHFGGPFNAKHIVQRALHISHRSSFKYFRQTGQLLEADKIEFTDDDTALYDAFVISVLLYGSETWTLLKADERRLEAFHMNCQRRILGIRWFHFVTNASVTV